MTGFFKVAAPTCSFILGLAVVAMAENNDPVKVDQPTPIVAESVELTESTDVEVAPLCFECEHGVFYGVDLNVHQMDFVSRTA